jgi:hypothetical protein
MDLKDKKLLQSLTLYSTEKSGKFAKLLSKHNKTQETFIPLTLNAKHTPGFSENLRNKIVDFNTVYLKDKKTINKLETETKDFSLGYNLVTENDSTNKQKKTEKILGEEILNRYKLQGYDIKNMFPKENIFQKSLLLEPDDKKFIKIMKNLTNEELSFENEYCKKLNNMVKFQTTLDKYRKRKNKNNPSTTNGDLETNFSLDDVDDVNDYRLIKYFQLLNSNAIKKQIKELKKDIRKTNLTLNKLSPKKRKKQTKLFEINNNKVNLIKKENINNFRSALIGYNKNSLNRNINDNLLKSVNTTTTNETLNTTDNNKKITNRRASSIIRPINFLRKKIPTDIKNTKIETNFDINHFENLTKNFEIKRQKEFEEQFERKRIKDLNILYKNIKSQSFKNSEKDIYHYLTMYQKPFPKKFTPSQGSNLNGLLTKFVNVTSYHNIPERIYNLKYKLGNKNKNEKLIRKETDIDKKINTLEYDYIEDILKLNENLK